MYMTQNEIADRYIRRGTSITILAELNAISVDQIREILTDAGVELPEVKKIKQQRIECCYDALDDIERRIKEYTQEHKAKQQPQGCICNFRGLRGVSSDETDIKTEERRTETWRQTTQ